MKNKALGLLALMFCMGVLFLSPMTAYAASDTQAPSIRADVNGGTLYIEAYDDTGVEAVYVGGYRFNYLVDGSLELTLKDYAGTGKTVAVYAVDYAGNRSETLEIDNPYYSAPSASSGTSTGGNSSSTPSTTGGTGSTGSSTTSGSTGGTSSTGSGGTSTSGGTTSSESAVPSTSGSSQNPFTPDGTGTVQDNATDGDEKEFFTITTADENVFYLIIDRQRDKENVYFLNTVTEEDLLSLAQKSEGNTGESAIPVVEPEPEPEPVEDTGEDEPEPEPVADTGTSMGTIIFIIIAAAAVGGAGYYFKILKPRQEAAFDEDDEDEDEMEYPDDEYPEDIEDGEEPADDDAFLPDEDYPEDAGVDGIPEDELTDPTE